MKIYQFALAIALFVGFSSVITSMGVFGNIYTHTNEVDVSVNSADIEGIKSVSGLDVMSESEMQSSNPDQGGLLSFIPGYSLFIKIIDMTINIDKLILEYTPPSSKEIVQPFANFIATIMQIVYAVGLISFLRRYKVD